jgi:hypothetical protein
MLRVTSALCTSSRNHVGRGNIGRFDHDNYAGRKRVALADQPQKSFRHGAVPLLSRWRVRPALSGRVMRALEAATKGQVAASVALVLEMHRR